MSESLEGRMILYGAAGKREQHMRIAVIGSRGLASEYSGIESMLRELCPRLVDRGHAVTVFGERCAVTTFQGASLEAVPSIGGKYGETLSRSLLATLRALRAEFDVIHFHDAAPALFGPLARAWGQPTVLTLHSLDWRRDKWPAAAKRSIKLIERMAVRSADRITVVSEPLRDYLISEYTRTAVVLPNIVEAQRSVPRSSLSEGLGLQPRGYILFVGRLVPEKGVHLLTAAFAALETALKLVIVGDDRYDERYSRELRRNAADDRIVFTGRLPASKLNELYSHAYLLVLPSFVEGCSMVALEAMAHGLPVLVSHTPENLHTIAGFGWSFRSGDTADLTAQLESLVTTPLATESMRRSLSRRNAALPGSAALASRYEQVYEEAIRVRRAPAQD